MYSTQSLLCPARASGLKSQGHLVPPTKKKKAATNTSSYKGRRKLVSSGGEIASRKPCAKNRSASHSPCALACLLSQRRTRLCGVFSVHQLQTAGPTQALGRQKALQVNPAREGTRGQSDDKIFTYTPGLFFNVKTSPWEI